MKPDKEKGEKPDNEAAEGEHLTGDQIHKGAMAKAAFKSGRNPPSWVADESTWDKAKTAASKTYSMDDDAFWPVVVSIYENMHGEVKSKAGAESDELLCFSAGPLASADGMLQYMPGGTHTITPSQGKRAVQVQVNVDQSSAQALEAQRAALSAAGRRPYFDFNHSDGEASFWPSEFLWKNEPSPGVYCKGDWTSKGKSGVEGREWRQFSPVFYVDDVKASPARIVCREDARPNMGGLVNDPAFHSILPFWAKNAVGAQSNTNQPRQTSMTPEELAALQAANAKLEQDIAALKARDTQDTIVASELRAKQAELEAGQAKAESARLKHDNEALQAREKARREADADAAIKAAIARGAIAAKDDAMQKKWRELIIANPDNAALLAAAQGAPAFAGRVTGAAGVQITTEAPNAVMGEFARLVATNTKIPYGYETAKEKGKLARQTAALFAKDIEKDPVIATMSVEDLKPLVAADSTNAAIGTLAGTLVLQRALPLMRFKYPVLSSITQDFSDTPAVLNQTETTRIVVKPAVQTYSTTADSAGRPAGWSTVSPAQTVDVAVKLDEYVGVPIVFSNQILASTIRDLFNETAPMALYSLGGYFVDKLTALLLSTNFNAYAAGNATQAGGGANYTVTNLVTNSTTTITYDSNTKLYPGQRISATGIPTNTRIASVTSATAAVLTQAATASATVTGYLNGATASAVSAFVPIAYSTYVKALADFDFASLGEIRAAFSNNEVPIEDRYVLLNASYYQKLAQDPTFNTYFAAVRSPEIITEGILPRLQGFAPMEAPYFPTTSSRVGFAGHKSSLIIKTRLPQDFTSAVGAMVPGSVTTVTADGGLSVLLVQYVSLRENYAEWRPEVLLGTAVGEPRAGMVITSA